MKHTLILAVALACLIGLLGGSLVAATGGKQPGTYQVIEVKGAGTSGVKEYLTILLEVESGETWILDKKKFTWKVLPHTPSTEIDISDE